jgi:hypothetical protein
MMLLSALRLKPLRTPERAFAPHAHAFPNL